MQLSVIILNYNVRYFLEQCVLSVQKALQNIDAEIIVVDNASSDDSCLMIREKFPNVILIENKENLGFPKGNNIGVAQAKGDFICILNPDTVVAEDTFTKILKSNVAIRNSQVGIIGCKLIDGAGNFLPESKRGVPTPWVAFTKIFGLYKIFPKFSWFNQYYAMHLNSNQSGEVDILVGAFMLMQRELYLKVDGFDENCFMYSDDIDLSYLVQKLGKKNYYFADTTVIHYKGESTIRDGLYMKRFQEAMNYFYGKHFKKSWFFDKMMQLGAFIFSFFKKSQQKALKPKIEKYIIVSKSKIDWSTTIPVEYVATIDAISLTKNKTIQILFNVEDCCYSDIIAFMENNAAPNISFKNYFPSSKFLIGSYNSNDRGEIITI
ncbi:glycosyltransferase family 2 protein [Flavobacterium sp.]|uniref:glycosyltransferase family 2 protein n=1 Tax=Flavobacterium sp. TaxID=239 RepID=UPI003528B727